MSFCIDKFTFSADLMEKIPIIIIAFDRDGKISMWNRKAEEITGFTRNEVLGGKVPLFLVKLLNKDLSGYPGTDRFPPDPSLVGKDHETSILTKNGKVKEIVWNLVENPSDKVRYILMGNDVTAQKSCMVKLDRKTTYLKTTKDRLKKYMTLDPHTGLLNYRHFINRFNALFHKAVKSQKPMSLLVLSLNYFNSINSTHGVSFGNKVLKRFARLILGNVDRKYLVARFSGKEFAVLMPDTDVNRAFLYAGRLFSLISDHNFDNDNSEYTRLSLSTSIAVGGYPYCEDVFTPNQLLDRVVDQLSDMRRKGMESIMICPRSRSIEEHEIIAEDDSTVYDEEYRYTMEFVNALANAVKTKDYYTQEHSAIMSNYAESIADYLGMNEHDIKNVKIGSMLHDIGKIGIDKMILLKPSALTPLEYSIIRQHPRIGAEIIRNVHPLKNVVPYVLYHHEKYNGDGYLYGLKGEEIPLGAKILSLADVFQALTSDRPYRRALSERQSFEIIRRNSGEHFDPKVVKAFFEVYKA